MIRKTLAVALTAVAIAPAMAQDSANEVTTATALAVTATTASAGAEDAVSTGARQQDGRRARMQGLNFERRWERTEQTYKEAGLSEDKIEKLKALERRVYEGMEKGEKVDYAAIREERNKILGADEQAKLREARQKMIERLRSNATTTATGAQ